MNQQLGTGAHPSAPDYRDVKDYHVSLAVPYPLSFTDDLSDVPVTMQHNIGICTSNLCYIIERLYEKRGIKVHLSRRFLYTVTKRYIDQNTSEGSSLRSALKAAYKYGVAPESIVPTDTTVTHEQFLAEYNWPQNVWQEALRYRIGGYISIGTDKDSLSAGIAQYGALYARFEVGSAWWLPDWQKCLPLQQSAQVVSGHAAIPFSYDASFPKNHMILRNSWSEAWGNKGNGDFFHDDYAPTEAWGITLDPIVNDLPDSNTFSHVFAKSMQFAETSDEVKNLQIYLKIHGYFDFPNATGLYGVITQDAVYRFQLDHVSMNWLEKYIFKGRYCGPKTIAALNSIK